MKKKANVTNRKPLEKKSNNILTNINSSNLFSKFEKDIKKRDKNKKKNGISNEFIIIRNPSSTKHDNSEELKKYNHLAKITILFDSNLLNLIYSKLNFSFEQISKYLKIKNKFNQININLKDIILKFLLNLKNIKLIYLDEALYNKHSNITDNFKGIEKLNALNISKFPMIYNLPCNKKEFEFFFPILYYIVSNYLKRFVSKKGLYIYIEEDYINN